MEVENEVLRILNERKMWSKGVRLIALHEELMLKWGITEHGRMCVHTHMSACVCRGAWEGELGNMKGSKSQ